MSRKVEAVNKPKNFKVSFKIFAKSIKKYGFMIILSVILAVSSAIFGLFIPKILGEMTTIAVDSYPDIDWGMLSQKAWLTIGLLRMEMCMASLGWEMELKSIPPLRV